MVNYIIKGFESTLLKKKYLTKDVVLLEFTKPEDFAFEAGQFVNIEIKRLNERKFRAYSILSPPNQKTLSIVLKIVEGGFASEKFKDIQEGESLLFKGPFGRFTFKQKHVDKEQWFFAGGTGVAPFYGMLKQYLYEHPNTKFNLVFSVRTKQDLFLHDEFLELSQKNNFNYHPTLTREEWSGLTGRVQTHLPKKIEDKVFYLCGLKDLVLDTRKILIDKKVDKNLIIAERYN